METQIISLNKEYIYDDEGIKWKIKLSTKTDSITIEVFDILTMLEGYKNTFNLSSLFEIDQIFKKAKNIKGVFDFLNHNFENKKFKLIKNDEKDNLIIQIKYNIDFFGENILELILSKIEIDSNLKAQKALEISLLQNKEISSLKKENDELKNKVKELELKYKNLEEKFSIFEKEFEKEKEYKRLFNNNKSKICETDEEIEFLKQMLPNKKLNLLYRATEHGDSVSTFHSRCDNKGENIVFYKTTKNKKFGGHSCKSWKSSGGWNNDNDDPNFFLFNLTTKKQYKPSDNYFKDHSSLYTYSNHGPILGPDNWWIGVVNGSGTILGSGYGYEHSNIQHMNINNSGYEFTGESSFTCVEVEIYQVI